MNDDVSRAPPPSDTYRVKGASIRSKLDFARARFGAEAETRLKRFLQSEGFFLVLESEWYPYEIFDRLLRRLADDSLGGDLKRLEEVGEHSARTALEGTYEAFGKGKDFLAFARRLSTLHGRFYDRGTSETHSTGPGSCEIRLQGAPIYSDPDMYVAAGFFTGAARFFGLEGVQHTVDRPDGGVRFRITWDPEPA